MQQYLFFLGQLLIIHLTARSSMSLMFHGLRKVFKNTSVSFYMLSLFYLPGTLVHELSHAFTSIVLFVIPHSLNVIPEVEEKDNGYAIRFGSVHHPKTDPIRGSIIGASPIIFGLGFFWFMTAYNQFPAPSFFANVLWVYLMFVISSSMFSSKEDMKDMLFIIPIAIFGIIAAYVFEISISQYLYSDSALAFMKQLNTNLLYPTILNTIVAIALNILYVKVKTRR